MRIPETKHVMFGVAGVFVIALAVSGYLIEQPAMGPPNWPGPHISVGSDQTGFAPPALPAPPASSPPTAERQADKDAADTGEFRESSIRVSPMSSPPTGGHGTHQAGAIQPRVEQHSNQVIATGPRINEGINTSRTEPKILLPGPSSSTKESNCLYYPNLCYPSDPPGRNPPTEPHQSVIRIAPGAGVQASVPAPASPPPPAPSAAPLETIEKIVAERAKPARVEFKVDTTMHMGNVYQARLEIHRPEKVSLYAGESPGPISEDIKVLDRIRASLESVHLKIERISDEWQDIPQSKRGLWLWKIEPTQPGTANLIVSVQHAVTVLDKEHRMTVEHFPRTVTIEVGWWQGMKTTIAGISPVFQTIAGLFTALATICGGMYGAFVWWRSRQRVGRRRRVRQGR